MNTQSKVLKWSLIVGIVIVINLFLNYSLSLVYKEPDYNTYCPSSQVNEAQTKEMCLAQGGQWNGYADPSQVAPTGQLNVKPAGYCDLQYTCRMNFDLANKSYQKNVFVTLVILGALLVLLGNFLKGNEVIAGALSFAGVLSFVIASMRYWGAANDAIRVGILGIALILLLWVAYKKFKN